jgi:hypothetical protein
MKKLLLKVLELFAENYTAKIGNKAKYSGVYRSKKKYISLSIGERFPPVLSKKWKLVVKL